MQTEGLREGYTTGTCAAAAAAVAAWYLFTGQERDRFSVTLPGGGTAVLKTERLAGGFGDWEEKGAWFFVCKDAGDDPDVTNRALICSSVEEIQGGEEIGAEGIGRYHSERFPFLWLTGGPGIGVVTRPGLSCPPGFYAINPVPRDMIFGQVGQMCEELGIRGKYLIRLGVPGGQALAKKTFNPRLGVEGGISILGTSGIVRPMSEQALKDTIGLEIHMRAEAGEDSLILVPGNYGERFLRDTFGIPVGTAVCCSNFAADAIRMAVREKRKRILFAGHMGKLVKIAGGAENTHSQYGDRRMEILAESLDRCRQAGKIPPLEEEEGARQRQRLLDCNTTEEAAAFLWEEGLGKIVMEDVTGRIWEQMNRWGQGKTEIQVLTFSSVYGILGVSSGWKAMMEEWREAKMRGTLYGVGVGPGDPEDMTLKAVRLLKQCPVTAIPKKDPAGCVSYQTARKAVPELADKELLCIDVPMTKDLALNRSKYEEGARQIAEYLRRGKDVALLTLGDATIYASDMYLARAVEAMGFQVEFANGVPSFCGAAARLRVSLGERKEQIHILPGSYDMEEGLGLPGVKILMKMGKSYGEVKERLSRGDHQVFMAENCGMDGERLYRSFQDLPDQAGYYSLMIVKDGGEGEDT